MVVYRRMNLSGDSAYPLPNRRLFLRSVTTLLPPRNGIAFTAVCRITGQAAYTAQSAAGQCLGQLCRLLQPAFICLFRTPRHRNCFSEGFQV
jgi:hypothetical protein